jgi:hypothetical protein
MSDASENAELEQELAEGRKAGRFLVEHMLCMNAASMEIPVFVRDEKYVIKVVMEPVQPIPSEPGLQV